MGKKSKANKLAKMSEEDRARYLQQRADIEEEARRRKVHLIALYMKNKLKREDAFCRLNMAKINQNWRSILRQIKCDELQKEMVELEKYCKEKIERKDRAIARLLNDLDVAENMYSTLQTSHMEMIRKLLDTYEQRAEFLRESYECEKQTMLKECEEEIRDTKEVNNQAQEQVECVAYQLEDMREKQMKENHERHLEKIDDLRATTQLRLEEITKTREERLEKLWQEYQDVLSGYVKRTEGFYAEYVDLKERDDESTMIMVANCREIEGLNDQLENLKALEAEKAEDNEFKVKHLTEIRDELAAQLAKRKQEVKQEIEEGEEIIKVLSVESHQAIEKLKKFEKKGETLLQFAAVCRKYETEHEKVMSSSLPFITDNMQQLSVQETEVIPEELPNYMKEVRSLGNWNKMEHFWRRVNNVIVDVMCLKQEQASLQAENERLKNALQEHLADLNIANGSNVHINDYLAKRPNSMRVDRVQPLDLEHNSHLKSMSASMGARRKAQRPFTAITEANFTNVVRSKRLVKGKSKLPRIASIVNW